MRCMKGVEGFGKRLQHSWGRPLLCAAVFVNPASPGWPVPRCALLYFCPAVPASRRCPVPCCVHQLHPWPGKPRCRLALTCTHAPQAVMASHHLQQGRTWVTECVSVQPHSTAQFATPHQALSVAPAVVCLVGWGTKVWVWS
jgi:hypothetical protein